MLGDGETRNGRASQGIEQLNGRIADGKASGRATGGSDFKSKLGKGLHGRLERHPCADGVLRGIAAIEPTSDGVTCKAEHAAVVTFDLTDQRIVNIVDLTGQFLDAMSRTQLTGQGFGQRGKTRNICKQGCALHAVGHVFATAQSTLTVLWEVGVEAGHGNDFLQ